ncbi:unnamed protein product, partial [Ostreobium quekettii]
PSPPMLPPAPEICPDGSEATEMLCDCKIISIDDFYALTQVTSVAGSSCKPVCEDRDRDLSNCKASCEEGRWDYTCVWHGCGTTIQAQAVDIIRTEACEYKE